MRALLLIIFLVLSACGEADPGPVCEQDCDTCAGGVCPPSHCGVKVVISNNCKGLSLGRVEVAVEQCVQPADLFAGAFIQLCQAIPVGETRAIVIRSDTRIWRADADCTEDRRGGTIVITASCEDLLPDVLDVAAETEDQ